MTIHATTEQFVQTFLDSLAADAVKSSPASIAQVCAYKYKLCHQQNMFSINNNDTFGYVIGGKKSSEAIHKIAKPRQIEM